MKKILLTYSMLFAAWLSLNAQSTTVFPIVLYENLYDNNNFTQAIDVNLSAGATVGDVSVTPSGAATYNIPISIPPGTRGVVPQLSIGYNSQAGNGLLGMGWNLSGFSAISRSGKSIAYDNDVSPVKLTNEDFFNLDGNRLVVTSGTNGAAASTYATKMETFSKVTAYGNIGGCPEYFIVDMKNGMIYEYGNTPDSKFKSNDGTKVISWQLNKVRDQYGNYMSYLYETTTDRELILKEINYTGNGALAPYNKVRFDYATRVEQNALYVAGEKISSKLLLTQIVVTTEDSKPVRTYEFTYGLRNDKSYLKRVREAGSDGKYMNPTIFKYGIQSEPVVYVGPTNTVYNNQESYDFFNQFYADVFSGDYNSDGFSDFIVAIKQEYPNDPDVYYNQIKVYYQKPNADGKLSLWEGPTKQFDYNSGVRLRAQKQQKSSLFSNSYHQGSYFNTFQPIDVNADGRIDIPLIFTEKFSDNLVTLKKIEILTLSNDGLNFESTLLPIPNSGIITANSKAIFWGDFDGDSKTDYIISYRNPEYNQQISFPSKQIFNKAITFSNPYNLLQRFESSDNVEIIDFDGDGKNELLFLASYYQVSNTYNRILDIFTFRIDAQNIYLEKLYEKTNIPQPIDMYSGDFNGDGKTDFLIHSFANNNKDEFSYPENPNWRISYSDGVKLVPNSLRFEFWGAGNYPDIKKDQVFIYDYDGDGLSDVMFFKDTKDATGTIEIRLFTNNGNTFQLNSKITGINYSEGLLSDFFIHGDFNGDGQIDIVDIERKKDKPFGANFKTRYYNFFPKTQERLLKGVMNGMKAESVIEYGLATYGKAEYTGIEFFKKTGVSSYPINYIVPAMNLAKAIEIPNGNNGSSSYITKSRFEYLYENPKVHRGGFGYLGFSKVTTFDRTNKTESSTEFETLTSPLYNYVTNAVKKQVTIYNGPDPSNPTLNIIKNLSESISTNSFVEANGRYRLQTDKIEEYNKLSGGFVTKEFWYDPYGNMSMEKTNTNNEEYSGVVMGGFTAIGNSVPVLPAWKTVNNSRNDENFSKDMQYQYTPQGALLQEKSFAFKKNNNNTDPSKYVLTEYEYNTFGNLIKTKLSSPLLPTNIKTSTSTYDTKGRFELTMTNNVGQTSSKTYYPEWGATKTAKSDITNLQSSFEYDGLGRLTKSTDPFSNVSTVKYEVFPRGYVVTKTQTNSPSTYEQYDFLGRVVESRVNINTIGQPYAIVNFNSYNEKGLLTNTHIPFKDSETSTDRFIKKTYDFLNRPLTVKTEGIDGETSYTYAFDNAGKTTIEVTNNAGQKSSKTTEATGKVISTTDYGGTLTFKYDGRGNQTEVKLSGQVLTTMEYDDWGRQKALVDANAGRTEYDYNAYGELIRQKDAKNNQYTMKYDALGRMWERTGPEGVTTTLFNTTGVAVNEVQKVTSFNGITEEYAYDTRGRVQQVTETIDNIAYLKTFTYNTFNQVLTTTYPSGLVVTNTYNTEGMLTKVMSGAQMLFDATSGKRDAFGHWTEYTRGDNKLNKSEYNAYGTPTRFNTTGVQDLNMVWDLKAGNLLSRQDTRVVGRNLKEDFLYTDNLNRLNQAQVVGLQPYTFVFKDNGNIDSKSDAGAKYIYDAAKINAVKYVKDYKNTIPSIQQDITYTPFLRCSTITEGVNQLEYTYASDYERRKGVLKINNIVENTRLYLGDYEINTDKNGVKTFVHYLSAAEAIVVKSGNNAFEYYFPYTDHLGSIVAVTNTSGALVAEQNFDAWGRKRNVNTWDYVGVQAVPSWLYRGYTGHEHLEAFVLINMNARLYDPVLGRMLSPDNYVGNANSQGFNRYSYANNNPLSYTDPTGNLAWFVPLIYAAVNVGVDLALNNGKMNLGQIALSAVQGALGGWLGGGAIEKAGQAFAYAGLSQASRLFPSIPIYQSEGFNLSVSPLIGLGTSGLTAGASINASGRSGNFAWALSASMGNNAGMSSLGEAAGSSNYWNFGAFASYNNYGLGVSSNKFDGNTAQRIAAFTAQIGDFSFRLDEDFFKLGGLGDGKDRYRTGGVLMTYRINDDVTLAFGGSMMTGEPGKRKEGGNPNSAGGLGFYDSNDERCSDIRGGTMFGGVIYKGQSYFGGHNSEKRLHGFQDWIHQNLTKYTPFFEDRKLPSRGYSYYGSYHPNYLLY
jgi:RHS repeat-associated protein